MPFYVGDYLGDTGHLSTTQHGAYILLICHYWRNGGLPDDDAKLARIAKLSIKNWSELIKPDLEPLFKPGWRHKRIDLELAKQDVITTKRAIAGKKGGDVTALSRVIAKSVSLSKHAPNQANARQLAEQIEHLPSKRVATTTTLNTDSSLVAAREMQAVESVERPKEATDEERVVPISQQSVAEIMERRKKVGVSHG